MITGASFQLVYLQYTMVYLHVYTMICSWCKNLYNRLHVINVINCNLLRIWLHIYVDRNFYVHVHKQETMHSTILHTTCRYIYKCNNFTACVNKISCGNHLYKNCSIIIGAKVNNKNIQVIACTSPMILHECIINFEVGGTGWIGKF